MNAICKNSTQSQMGTKISSYIRNENLVGLKCLRCDAFYEKNDPRIDSGLGCVKCLADDYPAGLHCVYTQATKLEIDASKRGMLRYASKLPFMTFPTLGEGQTSLVSLPGLANELSVNQLHVKIEGQNPTGSHKDRMSPLAIARALEIGCSRVVASSSGNAGASLAAYAANAGVDCRIISGLDIAPQWAQAIKLAGAQLILVEDHERWPLMQKMVQEENWFPVTNFWKTPIGSNPFGIEGYKTVAYEIVEDLREALPTVVMIPTCRGDLLLGVWRGFAEAMEAGRIDFMPRLVAVEPGARLAAVLDGGDYRTVFDVPANSMTSIDGGTCTYQSFKSLQSGSGRAIAVSNFETLAAQQQLAQYGLYVELSSASPLAALTKLSSGRVLDPTDRVVLIATSHGYKEQVAAPAVTSRACN